MREITDRELDRMSEMNKTAAKQWKKMIARGEARLIRTDKACQMKSMS